MTERADVLVLGGGMAGASAGYFLARAGLDVLLLEREAQPGYHSTGRSAALFSETYGPRLIRKLSTASRALLTDPPADFALEHPVLAARGLLELATADELGHVDAMVAEGRANGAAVERLDAQAVRAAVPILREGVFAAGVYEPQAMDIDVAALHQGFLRGFRHAGGAVATNAEAERIERGVAWRVTTRRGADYEAPVLVNAAGAWADVVAEQAGVRPLGLIPKRRTAVMIDLPAGTDPGAWPLAGDCAASFYFKPDAGRLMLSPADETPVAPQDVQPEIEDVAAVIERFMEVTTVEVERPGETWAGLRSFVADGEPVAGYASDAEGFFWLAGQGGYGIQTAAAMGRLAAALVQGHEPPGDMTRLGLASAELAPDRPSLQPGPTR